MIFLSIILALYYTVFAKKRQWICLLLASVVFYAFSGPKNLVFLLLTALTCWLGGLRLEKRSAEYQALRRGLKASKDGNEISADDKKKLQKDAKARMQQQDRKSVV